MAKDNNILPYTAITDGGRKNSNWKLTKEVSLENRVWWAIGIFKPLKSSALLQRGLEIILGFLLRIARSRIGSEIY